MSLTFTFDGIPVEKQDEIKDYISSQMAEKVPADITEADVLDYIKTELKKKMRSYQHSKDIGQAERDFNDNYSDPF